MMWSLPAVMAVRPSGVNSTDSLKLVLPSPTRCSRPVARSQKRIVLSSLVEATSRPSAEMARALTLPRWPASGRTSRPVAGSQRRMVGPPETTVLPSSVKASARIELGKPAETRSSLPASGSQKRRSRPPEASCRPSGVNANAVTPRRWPFSWHTPLPVAVSHTIRSTCSGCCPSQYSIPAASSLPSGENATVPNRWRASAKARGFGSPTGHRRISPSAVKARSLPSGERAIWPSNRERSSVRVATALSAFIFHTWMERSGSDQAATVPSAARAKGGPMISKGRSSETSQRRTSLPLATSHT